jgi:ribonuclease P protein component
VERQIFRHGSSAVMVPCSGLGSGLVRADNLTASALNSQWRGVRLQRFRRVARRVADPALRRSTTVTGLGAIAVRRFDLDGVRSVPLSPRVPVLLGVHNSCCRESGRCTNYCCCLRRSRGRQPDVMERDREQADFPTEQPPPGEDPRIPAADAHPRWPCHPAGPPSEGPQRAVGISRTSVLPAARRLRSSSDFSAVTRHGHRTRCGGLVVYLLPDSALAASRVGLVVGKAVGGSVVRHQVSRRLRAQLSQRLDQLPAGSRLVVRALPDTATANSHELGRDLDRALRRLAGDRP